MADNQNIKTLIRLAIHNQVPANFEGGTIEDVQHALREEIKSLAGTRKEFRRNKNQIFELIEDTIDEVLPNKIGNVLSQFVEVVQFAQGQAPIFKTRLGQRRGKQFVTRAAPNGTYETFRLDRGQFMLELDSYGGAGYVDFERYLDGLEDLMDLYEILIEGLNDRIFDLIQGALLASYKAIGVPTSNRAAFSSFDPDLMYKVLTTIDAYGPATIYCGPEFAASMSNHIQYVTPMMPVVAGSGTVNRLYPVQDINEIRENGYIGKFRGHDIVVFPQTFTDETNTKKVINPRVAYILPGGKEKLIRLGMEGDTHVREYSNKGDESMEIQLSKRLGVAMVAPVHAWGMVENTGIQATGWDQVSD